MVLGIMSDPPYSEGKVQLQQGDRIVLYTDGVSEASDASGKEFGAESLLPLLEQADGNSKDLCNSIVAATAAFNYGPPHDDVTCVCVRVLQP